MHFQAAETATLPQTATELAAVVATIESNETIEYAGHVVTQEEATAHLETTQLTVATEETKALLAGKTFYLAYIDEDVERIEKLEVNADATSLTWTVIKGGDDSGVDPVTIEGTSFFTGNEEHIIQGSQDQYLEVLTNNNLDRLYYSQADAEAYLDSLVTTDAKSILSGKTFYYIDDTLYEDGLYADSFTDTTLIEKEYDKDGKELSTVSIEIAYSGTNLVLIEGDDTDTCSVTRADISITIYCPSDGYTQILWDSISDAKANP